MHGWLFHSYDEALCDFESAVRLNRTLPSPHVCAGLVHMLHKNNVIRAIRSFSTAIFVDPTCIRAYLCRADAYQRDAKVSGRTNLYMGSCNTVEREVFDVEKFCL